MVNDYRDRLRTIIERAEKEHRCSRYRLCKALGLEVGVLNDVLSKKKHYSVERLEQVLTELGLTMRIERI